MQLEFHQLDRRWEHLRVRQPRRQQYLIASLAESGQQTPIVVVRAPDHRDRYLVIDAQAHRGAAATGPGHGRSHRLGDGEAEAVLLDRSMRFSSPESALEQGWLLSGLERRFGYSLEELARRFDRSVS